MSSQIVGTHVLQGAPPPDPQQIITILENNLLSGFKNKKSYSFGSAKRFESGGFLAVIDYPFNEKGVCRESKWPCETSRTRELQGAPPPDPHLGILRRAPGLHPLE